MKKRHVIYIMFWESTALNCVKKSALLAQWEKHVGHGYYFFTLIKQFLQDLRQLLMTVYEVLPDGWKVNPTFLLNTRHILTKGRSVRNDLEVKWQISRKIQMQHIYHQRPHYGFSSFSETAPVVHPANLCLLFLIGPFPLLTRFFGGCRARHCDWGKVISSLTFSICSSFSR